MRFAFALLIIVHGLIHVMGFIKAFKIKDIDQLSQSISKSIGILWLLVAILFMTSVVLYLLKKDWWFFIAIPAVIISQILIIMYWKDAKLGTSANILILLAGIMAYGSHRFNKRIVNEVHLILQPLEIKSRVVTQNDINPLPPIVQQWMRTSGVVGKEEIRAVRLKQGGTMRTKPKTDWMSFAATQYVNVQNPAFVWSTNVDAFFGLNLKGRDKFHKGEGAMLIKVASLIPVVNVYENEKINSGAMIRFLAEICWYPSAALNDYMTWETIDSTAAKATFKLNQKSVSGIFKFNSHGDVISFEADRYFGGNKNAELEKWVITMESYKIFGGIKIPAECKVTWKLPQGDFNWLKLEIWDLEFNVAEMYSH